MSSDTGSIVEQTLQLLNDDPTRVYSFSYDPMMQAYKVYLMIEVKHDSAVRADSLFKLVPASVNHARLADALKDALILKMAGHKPEQHYKG